MRIGGARGFGVTETCSLSSFEPLGITDLSIRLFDLHLAISFTTLANLLEDDEVHASEVQSSLYLGRIRMPGAWVWKRKAF